MSKTKILSFLFLVTTSITAAADENDVKWSANIKAWNSTLKTSTEQATSSIPNLSLTARKGNYFVTYSSLLQSSYALPSGSFKRKDTDLALGWRFYDGLSLLAGHKYVYMAPLGSDLSTNGTYVGLTGNTPIGGTPSFLYGTGTYMVTRGGQSGVSDSAFYTGEVGLGYALNNSVQVTFGTRSQEFKYKKYPSTERNSVSARGIIVGTSFNFN
jgi:hypothetical protein